MPWPSSLVLLSAIAAATTRLRLAACAVIAPLRHPLFLARELGTLDLLSEGRSSSSRPSAGTATSTRRSACRSASAESCSTSSSQRGKASGVTRRRHSPASTIRMRTSISSPRHGARMDRACGSEAGRCIRACCGGSSAMPTASIPSGSLRGRHGGAAGRNAAAAVTSPSSSSWVGCGLRSRTTTALLRSSRRSRRSLSTRPRIHDALHQAVPVRRRDRRCTPLPPRSRRAGR